jgi:hypothetical protein
MSKGQTTLTTYENAEDTVYIDNTVTGQDQAKYSHVALFGLEFCA